MSNQDAIVNVVVSLAGGGVTRTGFGVGMLLSNTGNAWNTPELTRTYTKDSFAADFASTTPEYQALTQFFGQAIKPTSAIVGKGPTKPTQVKTIAISAVTLNAIYKVNAYALGVLQQATYTAIPSVAWVALTVYTTGFLVTNDTGKLYICITAGTAAGAGGPTGTAADITDGTVHWMYAGTGSTGVTTNDAIAYGIMKSLNALAAPDIAATSALSGSQGSKIVTTTGDAAGNWFALEPLASGDEAAVSNLMALTDTTTDPGVAADLDAIYSANPAWYALLLLFQSSAIVTTPTTGADAWAQGKGRLLLVSSADTAAATTAFPGSDMLDVMTDAGQSYIAANWHPRDYEWFAASVDGRFLPLDPGSDNWIYKELTGVTPVSLTTTQQTNLRSRRAGFYYTLAPGANVVGGRGQVESTTFGFIDTRRNIDWWTINLQDDLIDLLIQNNKVANTNAGRRKIALVIKARNDAGITAGVISPDALNAAGGVLDPYTVFVPDASDATSFDATTRSLSGVTTAWKLAGAIDSITVNAVVTQ